MASPTSRTKEWLRALGYVEDTVEQRQAWKTDSGYSPLRDWCNFADLVAFSATRTLAVQCTSTTNVASRVTKCLAEPRAWLWLQAPGRSLWVVGWKKYAKPLEGHRKFWRPMLQSLVSDEFEQSVVLEAKALLAKHAATSEKVLRGLVATE